MQIKKTQNRCMTSRKNKENVRETILVDLLAEIFLR